MNEIKRKKLAEKIFDGLEILMCNLYARWQDEKEYEDFEDYIHLVKNKLKEFKVTFLKMTKRPFCVHYELDGVTYVIFVNSRQYGYKRVA